MCCLSVHKNDEHDQGPIIALTDHNWWPQCSADHLLLFMGIRYLPLQEKTAKD